LNRRTRCGCRPCAAQMRCTERSEIPLAAAIARPVQCVAAPSGSARVSLTTRSCSWANAVESFFATLTRRRLQRGVFRSPRPAGRDQPLSRRAQPQTQTLCLDRRSRPHRARRARRDLPLQGLSPKRAGPVLHDHAQRRRVHQALSCCTFYQKGFIASARIPILY